MPENIHMGSGRGQVIIWTFWPFVPAVQTKPRPFSVSLKADRLLKAHVLCAISSIDISVTSIQEVGGILLLFFLFLMHLSRFIWTLFAIKAILNIALKKSIVLSEIQLLSFAEAERDWDRKKSLHFQSPFKKNWILHVLNWNGFNSVLLLTCSLHLPIAAQQSETNSTKWRTRNLFTWE